MRVLYPQLQSLGIRGLRAVQGLALHGTGLRHTLQLRLDQYIPQNRAHEVMARLVHVSIEGKDDRHGYLQVAGKLDQVPGL